MIIIFVANGLSSSLSRNSGELPLELPLPAIHLEILRKDDLLDDPSVMKPAKRRGR